MTATSLRLRGTSHPWARASSKQQLSSNRICFCSPSILPVVGCPILTSPLLAPKKRSGQCTQVTVVQKWAFFAQWSIAGQGWAPAEGWEHAAIKRKLIPSRLLARSFMAGVRFSSNTNLQAFILISPVAWAVYTADRKTSKDTGRKHSETRPRALEEEAGKRVFCFLVAFDCSNTEYLGRQNKNTQHPYNRKMLTCFQGPLSPLSTPAV